ncbi:MAG: hypothetical protein DHS80DRAFT_16317 [Piptocephalis tieghemiana]|nr:MAG: hypothetical protein DHS80DRAFT_16317 [Piptocephalis tieghemiana]
MSILGRRVTWVVYVIGAYLRPTHIPFLVAQFQAYQESGNGNDYEHLLRLGELMGQVKPPTTTASAIHEAGLETRIQGQPGWDVGWKKEEVCSVCLEEWEPGVEIRLLKCGHGFHRTCVDRWLCEGANRCPNCRVQGVPAQKDEASSSSSSSSTATQGADQAHSMS